MPYSARMQKNHYYSVLFAPRGYLRMADTGMQITQMYLSPFDKLIGVVGDAGAGKSILIKGMFPGLELTNDDEGVNVRPLPLLNIDETGFYTPHTYHVDVRFESGFTQLHELATAIMEAVKRGKRVIVEHFEMVYPLLNMNAHLLIGVGEEIIITRPTLFGPEPADISEIVHKSIVYRRMTHTAEDLCEFFLKDQNVQKYEHADVRHGFVLSFADKPEIDIGRLEREVRGAIAADLPIAYHDDSHILIGDAEHVCTGPRMHVGHTGQITGFSLYHELLREPITERYLLVGMVGEHSDAAISDLNKLDFSI